MCDGVMQGWRVQQQRVLNIQAVHCEDCKVATPAKFSEWGVALVQVASSLPFYNRVCVILLQLRFV